MGKAGVNTEIAFQRYEKGYFKLGSRGKDASVEFQNVLDKKSQHQNLRNGIQMAIEVFGAKAGPDLADAI